MQRIVFDGFVSNILEDLSQLNDDFAEDTSFPESSLARSSLSSTSLVKSSNFFIRDWR
jgi:hypothetical protein